MKQTVLGDLRENPYSVSNMIDAWNNTYQDTTISSMQPTHLYVKFSPADEEDMFLLEDTDEMLYDYPLEYEVVEMGDYYPQPGKTNDDYPDFFAVVPPDFTFPEVPYTIEEELVIPRYMSYLVGEAFRLTNNDHPLAGEIPESSVGGPCQPGCPDYPCCLDSPNQTPKCGDCIKDPCIPGSPNYPNCLITGGPVLVTNSCGCQVSADSRHPGGCIDVQDTELGSNEALQKVKVIVKDTWFTEDETYTDANGCWKITNRRYHGRAWVWVKFKNNDSQIRGTYRNWQTIWNWAVPVKDYVGAIHGAPFNEISIIYTVGTNASQAHRYWSAATIHNALQEFNTYALQDNINPAPYLDIYVYRFSTIGAAPMTHHIGLANYTSAVNSGLWSWLDAGYVGSYVGQQFTLGLVGSTYFLAPDIIIGTDFNNSDQLKRLAYHEIAHGSHYSLVGNSYWSDLIDAETTADGHGDQFSQDAGLIAVAESWAEYLAMSYTHRTYGTQNSLIGAGVTWQSELEQTRNESLNHIPIGVHFDLFDPVGNEAVAFDDDGSNSGPITDQVVGFTNQQMFLSLNSNVLTPAQYQMWLNSNYSNVSGNTTADVDNLFNSY